MKLSVPIHRLKRRAKQLSREKSIPLHAALDHVAAEQGFDRWSLLSAKVSGAVSPLGLFEQLMPGDLVLLGARPGQGKTKMGLELIMQAIEAGRRGVFFFRRCV